MEFCKHGRTIAGTVTFTTIDRHQKAIVCECCGELIGLGPLESEPAFCYHCQPAGSITVKVGDDQTSKDRLA